MGRDRSSFRKRDLRIAREVAEPGDRIEVNVRLRTISIIKSEPGAAVNGGETANPWNKVLSNDADKKRPA